MKEEFVTYKDLISSYIKMRFNVALFAGFSVLLAIMAITDNFNWSIIIENFIFIFITLFLFRHLDDAFSFFIDRIDHPERDYIQPHNSTAFVIITSILTMFYILASFLFYNFLALVTLCLISGSVLLYSILYKNRNLMLIIPLLKYPFIVWCATRFSLSHEALFLSAGAFLMVLAFDVSENYSNRKAQLFVFFLLIISGAAVIQPWAETGKLWLDIVLIIIPLLLFFFPKLLQFKYWQVVIFPIIHLVDVLI